MARPPTAKQLEFAVAIKRRTGVPLPTERTRQSLFLYIRDNRPKLEHATRHDWTEEGIIDREQDIDMAECFGIDTVTGCLGD